jgi:hypothetical protein
MKKKFCCDASRQSYENYYVGQAGSGLSVFQGSRGQRGHGIGSTLAGLFRSALPMIKRGLTSFGRQALSTGMQVVGDMADGQNFSDSAKLRTRQGIKRLAQDGVEYLNGDQGGSGYKRRRVAKKKKKKGGRKKKKASKKKKKKKRSRDIFD